MRNKLSKSVRLPLPSLPTSSICSGCADICVRGERWLRGWGRGGGFFVARKERGEEGGSQGIGTEATCARLKALQLLRLQRLVDLQRARVLGEHLIDDGPEVAFRLQLDQIVGQHLPELRGVELRRAARPAKGEEQPRRLGALSRLIFCASQGARRVRHAQGESIVGA